MVNVAAGDSRAYLGRLAMALGVIIWGTLLAWSAGAAQPPRVAAAETTHDFGQVFEDHQLTHTFTLENLGKEPLEIREVDPDCDCTIPSYDRRIAPGGKGKITLSIKPYSVMRQFQKNTVIRFRDAEVPDLTLVLKGVAQPIIEIQPNHIIRLRGSVAEPLSGRIRSTSICARSCPARFTSWKCATNHGKPDITPEKSIFSPTPRNGPVYWCGSLRTSPPEGPVRLTRSISFKIR
jgi:hypothetical protein